MPHVNRGTVDVYNNYYYDLLNGIGVGINADILVEANFFEQVTNPIYFTGNGGVVRFGTLPNIFIDCENYDEDWYPDIILYDDGYTSMPSIRISYPRNISDANTAKQVVMTYSGVMPEHITIPNTNSLG